MKREDLGTVRNGAAILINILVLVVLLVVIGLIAGDAHSGQGSASVNLTGGAAVIWVLLALIYLVVPKLLFGQTLGRRLLGGKSPSGRHPN